MDVFSEVAILQACAGEPGVCRLLDFGLEGDTCVLALQRYPASLAAWRAARPPGPPGPGQLRLHLRIFADVLAAMQARRCPPCCMLEPSPPASDL